MPEVKARRTTTILALRGKEQLGAVGRTVHQSCSRFHHPTVLWLKLSLSYPHSNKVFVPG